MLVVAGVILAGLALALLTYTRSMQEPGPLGTIVYVLGLLGLILTLRAIVTFARPSSTRWVPSDGGLAREHAAVLHDVRPQDRR